MTHKHIFKIIGNGDAARGKAICTALALRLIHARAKHPWPQDAQDAFWAAAAISGEIAEVYDAEAEGDMEQYAYELVDVMTTAVRAYNREWVNDFIDVEWRIVPAEDSL